ncbi:MAG: Rieske (2Fe-2S) protein [Chitinophagaceae bacterium]
MFSTEHYIPFTSLEFNSNNIAVTEIEGKQVCIAKHRDEYFAFLNRCPHATAPLDNGFIDALGFIVCPLHHYRFSLKNGRDSNNEGYRMKIFGIRIENEGLNITI